MSYEITIRNYDTGNVLKIIIDTHSIEVILEHIKNLKAGNDILKVKLQKIPIVSIDAVLLSV
jgi:hypothetical protein